MVRGGARRSRFFIYFHVILFSVILFGIFLYQVITNFLYLLNWLGLLIKLFILCSENVMTHRRIYCLEFEEDIKYEKLIEVIKLTLWFDLIKKFIPISEEIILFYT